VIAKLADALDKSLDEPTVRERLAKLGGSIPARPSASAAFDRFVRAEIARWAPILAPPPKRRSNSGRPCC
jgi:tripartite-type tricarboxylate transporter receptor subunit TctC